MKNFFPRGQMLWFRVQGKGRKHSESTGYPWKVNRRGDPIVPPDALQNMLEAKRDLAGYLERKEDKGRKDKLPRDISGWAEEYCKFHKSDQKKDLDVRMRWVSFLVARSGHMDITTYRPSDAVEFKKAVSELPGKGIGTDGQPERVSDATVAGALRYASNFFSFPKKFGVHFENPFAHISKPRAHPKEIRYTRAEAEALVAASPAWFSEIVKFALFTGLRRSEIMNLDRVKDIDFQNKQILVTGKGNKRASIPMIAQVGAILGRVAPNLRHTKVFSRPDGNPLTVKVMVSEMKKAKERARIEKPGSWHILRHTAASWMIEGGVPHTYVQRVLRHSSPMTTSGYIHEDSEAVRIALEAAMGESK